MKSLHVIFVTSLLILISSCTKEPIDENQQQPTESESENAYSSSVTECSTSNLERVSFSDVDVTHQNPSNLTIVNSSSDLFGIYTKSSRAQIKNDRVSSSESKLRFRYLGHSTEDLAFGSGQIIRQIGLKVRTKNSCNVLYLMWKIEKEGDPSYEEKITIGYKSNPGMLTSSECQDADGVPTGYSTIATNISPPLSSAQDGLFHTIEAILDPYDAGDQSSGNDFILNVCIDGISVWQGELQNIERDIDGPSGIRTDNGKFEFQFFTDIDPSSEAWQVSYSAQSYWRQIRLSGVSTNNMRLGDFNGDGKTDVFRHSSGKWYVSLGAESDWIEWNTSNVSHSELRFGDFDGDGSTDVFRTANGNWYLSNAGESGWITWGVSNATVNDLKLGDFNGDGKTDLLWWSSGKWYVSESGQSSWIEWNTSNYGMNDILIGDFNGDGVSDALRSTNGTWYMSSGASANSVAWKSSNVAIENMKVADFNGDGADDIIRSSNGKWYVSLGAQSDWIEWGTSNKTIQELRFGDFNGDGEADALSTTN